MDDLAIRLAALDPEASAAVKVIATFDSLAQSRAGMQSIVRTAAALVGCPVHLIDTGQRLSVRVLAGGAAVASTSAPDPTWVSAPVTADGAVLWLEHPRPASTVEAVVLERAAAVLRNVLERTRSRTASNDPASWELLLAAGASEADRVAAARRLGLIGPARAVALLDGAALVISAAGRPPAGQRAGVGPAVPVRDLPASWSSARLALRLTGEGTDDDPGPRVVDFDEIGILSLLVKAADESQQPIPDLQALQRAAAAAPWALVTLDGVASTGSMRDTARTLQLHHSSLQHRLTHIESVLGWNTREPPGRLRLQLALALRRALRSAPSAAPTALAGQ